MLFVSDAVTALTGWAPQDFLEGRINFTQLTVPDEVPPANRTRVAGLSADGLVDPVAAVKGRVPLWLRGRLRADADRGQREPHQHLAPGL